MAAYISWKIFGKQRKEEMNKRKKWNTVSTKKKEEKSYELNIYKQIHVLTI